METSVASGVSKDAQAMMAFESSKKSVGVAYLLWFFLGWIGVHRFYVGKTGSGIAMLVICIVSFVLSFVAIGLLGYLIIGVWWLVDAFLLGGLTREYNQALAQRINAGLGA